MEATSIRIFASSTLLRASKWRGAILFKKLDLLHSLEVTVDTAVYFDDISLDSTAIPLVAIHVWDNDPQLIIQVVHLCRSKEAISSLLVSICVFLVCTGPIQEVVLRSPRLEVFLSLAFLTVKRNEWLVRQVARSKMNLAINCDESDLLVLALDFCVSGALLPVLRFRIPDALENATSLRPHEVVVLAHDSIIRIPCSIFLIFIFNVILHGLLIVMPKCCIFALV